MNTHLIKTDQGLYMTETAISPENVVEAASKILLEQLIEQDTLSSANHAKHFLQMALAAQKHEQFSVLFLDTQHKIIAFEKLFNGTINRSVVHPRLVVQRAMALNAAAVIFAHNHPSGEAEPSQADKDITEILVNTLDILDIRVLDHIIVTSQECVSFAELGLI